MAKAKPATPTWAGKRGQRGERAVGREEQTRESGSDTQRGGRARDTPGRRRRAICRGGATWPADMGRICSVAIARTIRGDAAGRQRRGIDARPARPSPGASAAPPSALLRGPRRDWARPTAWGVPGASCSSPGAAGDVDRVAKTLRLIGVRWRHPCGAARLPSVADNRKKAAGVFGSPLRGSRSNSMLVTSPHVMEPARRVWAAGA